MEIVKQKQIKINGKFCSWKFWLNWIDYFCNFIIKHQMCYNFELSHNYLCDLLEVIIIMFRFALFTQHSFSTQHLPKTMLAKSLYKLHNHENPLQMNLPVANFRKFHNHPIREAFEKVHVRCKANEFAGNVRWKIGQSDSIVVPWHQCTARLISTTKRKS